MYSVDYRYLRPRKAAAMKQQHEAEYQCLTTPHIWHGNNVTILPVQKIDKYGWIGQGGCVDASGKSVPFSAGECCVQPIDISATSHIRDEKVVYCGYMIHHWGHFLVEGVARLWYFLENDPTVDKYIFVLDEGENREIQGNYKEFLQLLGIWEKLEFINQPTTFREVIVPDLAFRRFGSYSPKYLDIFNTVAEHVIPSSNETPNKIFMSRSLLPKHKDVDFGFESIDNFFALNGYTIVYPERVPLSQMIQYIRNAEIVASVSGSLSQNILFGKQGQKLLILERCAIINDWQPPVDRIKELCVTYIDSNISLYTVPMTGPFIMGYTDLVQKYASDNNMTPPAEKYRSNRYLRSCFVGFMKSYSNLYRYRWFIEEYLLKEMDYHMEAYDYAYTIFGDYLDGKRPFLWHHYFELHYWKQFVKRLLRMN